MRRRPHVIPLLGVLLLVGCAGADEPAASPTAADTPAATAADTPTATAADDGSADPAGGGDDGAATAEPATVTATNFAFDTAEIVAPAGATIEFTVAEGSHSLTSEQAGFDTGILSDTTVTVTVDGAPGTYTYRCTLHGQMTGEITVVG